MWSARQDAQDGAGLCRRGLQADDLRRLKLARSERRCGGGSAADDCGLSATNCGDQRRVAANRTEEAFERIEIAKMVVAVGFAASVVRPTVADLLEFFEPVSCFTREVCGVGNIEIVGVKNSLQRGEVEAIERGHIFLPDDARLLLGAVAEDADIPRVG